MEYYAFTISSLINEIVRIRREGASWFWYKDVLLDAEQKGFIKITKNSEEKPFWWNKFDDSVENLSEQLKQKISQDDKDYEEKNNSVV